jgi:hypothetical protein
VLEEYSAGKASLEQLDKAEDDISQYCHQMLLKYR